jgi:hypothetical protein
VAGALRNQAVQQLDMMQCSSLKGIKNCGSYSYSGAVTVLIMINTNFLTQLTNIYCGVLKSDIHKSNNSQSQPTYDPWQERRQ